MKTQIRKFYELKILRVEIFIINRYDNKGLTFKCVGILYQGRIIASHPVQKSNVKVVYTQNPQIQSLTEVK